MGINRLFLQPSFFGSHIHPFTPVTIIQLKINPLRTILYNKRKYFYVIKHKNNKFSQAELNIFSNFAAETNIY